MQCSIDVVYSSLSLHNNGDINAKQQNKQRNAQISQWCSTLKFFFWCTETTNTMHTTHYTWMRSLQITYERGRCLCAYSIHIIYSYELTLGNAHYHIILVSQYCNNFHAYQLCKYFRNLQCKHSTTGSVIPRVMWHTHIPLL